jgi:hypothetical protein
VRTPGNPWKIEFRQGLFNMTSDSGLFRTAAQLLHAGFARDGSDWLASGFIAQTEAEAAAGAERYVSLYEAKMVSFYDHRAASYAIRGNDRGFKVLPPTSDQQHAQPDFEPKPFYWVSKCDAESRLKPKRVVERLVAWMEGHHRCWQRKDSHFLP